MRDDSEPPQGEGLKGRRPLTVGGRPPYFPPKGGGQARTRRKLRVRKSPAASAG